jgi:hypothetical protein
VRTARLLARLAASGLVLSGAVVFVISFGPRATPAHADIYGPLLQAAGFLPAPPGSGTTQRAGEVRLNGQTFTYVVGRSELPLDAVLSHYERQFVVERPDGQPPLATAARVEAPGAGVVAGVRLGALEPVGGIAARAERFARTMRLGDFGRFHVVSAYEQQGTVFIEFAAGDDVELRTLMPVGAADAPGLDPEGVPRPPGLQRAFTIEVDRQSAGAGGPTVVYRAADARAAAAAFRRGFLASGWRENAAVSSEALAHYVRQGRECFVGGLNAQHAGAVVLVCRSAPSGAAE